VGGVDPDALSVRWRVRVPGGLAALSVQDGIGTHVEPNVWVLHRVD
jgi:hypothetical protein